MHFGVLNDVIGVLGDIHPCVLKVLVDFKQLLLLVEEFLAHDVELDVLFRLEQFLGVGFSTLVQGVSHTFKAAFVHV